jgi:hypothetical protein
VPGPVALGGEVADILCRRAAEHAMVRDHLKPGLGERGDLFRMTLDFLPFVKRLIRIEALCRRLVRRVPC